MAFPESLITTISPEKPQSPTHTKEKDAEQLNTNGEPSTSEDEFVEGGLRGWLVVLGCFIISAVTLGWGLVWGVFQVYYKQHNMLPGVSDAMLSFLGCMQSGVMTIASFVFGKLGDRYGYKPFIALGSCISIAATLGAAFSTKLWQFIITQGILQGLCIGMVFPMIVSYPAQWFRRRRALASGVIVAGSSVGGGAASLILRVMLSSLSFRLSMSVYTGINAALLLIAFFLVKGRGPERRVTSIEWVDRSQFKDLTFWSTAACYLICTFGFLPPAIYISPYTVEKIPDINNQLAIAPIAVLNFSAAIGRTIVGLSADRVGPLNALIATTFIAGLSQLLIWQFAYSFWLIMIFAVVCGAFVGCFISLVAPVAAQLFGTQKLATITGLLVLFNLPGNLAGSPLLGTLLEKYNWHAAISFSGGMQVLGGICAMYARFKREPRLFARY
ncbi:hypothetical protein FRC02_002034 [Tulasnella sp. 418]|nr:hypothetical protein FRC02_002034 [Tulasnella sp. 418]